MHKQKSRLRDKISSTLLRTVVRVLFAISWSVLSTPVIFYTRVYTRVINRNLGTNPSAPVKHFLGSVFSPLKFGKFTLATILTLGMIISLGMTLTHPAAAASSNVLNFQARLEGANGAIVNDGNYNVEFKLYSASSGGSALWTEDYLNSASNGVRVVDGYLTVNLGSITPFPSTIPWDQQLYLTMNVGGTTTTTGTLTWDGEMSPRLELTSVPYAFQAQYATEVQASNGSNIATLSFITPTQNDSISLPDASGTVCLDNTTACGFASASGSSSYIQNGTSIQSNANFDIQSTSTTASTGVIEALGSQTSDLLQFLASNGTSTLSGINSTGQFFNQSGIYTGTLVQKTLGQSTTYNLPDPGVSSVDFCLSTGNCAGTGGGITGAGTTNYVARFNTGSTISASTLLYDNNSFVGVNNTTGDGELSVTSSSSTVPSLFVKGSSSATAATLILQDGTTPGVGGDLLDFENSSGGLVASVDSAGDISTTGNLFVTGTSTVQGVADFQNSVTVQSAAGLTLGVAGSATGNLILENAGSSFATTLTSDIATANQTITIPNTATSGDTVCLKTLANCTGTGGGIAGSGTEYYLAEFDTVGGNHISSLITGAADLYDNGSFLGVNTTTNSGLVSIQGASTIQSSLVVQSTASATVPVETIKEGVTPTQSADLLALQDSTGANIASVDSAGDYESTGNIDNGVGGIGDYGNLLEYSEAFDNGLWTTSGITVTPNDVASNPAPDGNTTADKLVSSAAGATIKQSYSTSTVGTYDYSVWVKTDTGTQPIQLRLDSTSGTPITGAGASFTATTTWQRFSVTQAFTGSPAQVKANLIITNSGATVVAWGGQLVNANEPEVYVRTTSSTVNSSDGVVSNGQEFISGVNSSTTELIAQAAPSQTANVLEVQNSAGANVATIDASGNLSAAGGSFSGNITQTGATTFSTGTGAINFNGNTSITSNNTFSVGSGLTTLGGGATITGAITLAGGTASGDITTTGNVSAATSINIITGSSNSAGGSGANVNIQGGSETGTGSSKGGSVTIDAGTASSGTGITGSVNIGTTNAGTVLIGNTTGTNVTTLQSGTGGTLNLGNGKSGTVNVAATTSGTISIGTSNTNNVTLGSTSGANATLIQGGTGINALGIQSGTNGTISLGTSVVDTVNIGNSTSTSATLIQGGVGSTAVGIQAGTAGTISIGTTVAGAVIIGNTTGNDTTTIQSGTGATGNLNLGNGNSGAINVLATTSGTISIGNGNTNNVVLGNTTSTSTTLIQGGTGASSVGIQAGTAGTISIGTANASNVTLGNNSGANKTLIQGGTGSSAVTVQATGTGSVTIGGTSETGAITLGNGTGTNTINIGTGDIASGVQSINIGGVGVGGSTSLYLGSTAAGSITGLYGPSDGQTFTSSGDIVQTYTNTTTGFAVQNSAGYNVLAADTTNGQVVLGNSTHLSGTLAFANGTAGNSYTTSIVAAPQASASDTITIPADTATNDNICLQTLANCTANPGGTGYFINNQMSSPQTSANFDISGIGIANTSIQTPIIDSLSGGSLSVGPTTSTVTIGSVTGTAPQTINVGDNNVTGSTDIVKVGNLLTTSTTTIQGGTTNTGNGAVSIQAGAAGLIGIGNGGTTNAITIGSTTAGAISHISGSSINTTIGASSTLGATNNTTNSGTGYGYTIQAGSDTGTTSRGGNITIDAGTGTTANGTVNLGTTNASAVNVGNTTSATLLQGGTAGVQLVSGATTGSTTSGAITIQSGSSASGAAGSISIDTGQGAAGSGSVLVNDTFEGNTGDITAWYPNAGSNPALSYTAAQHQGGTGADSLQIKTTTNANWGVYDYNTPYAVTPGQTYNFSAWVRAATTSETIYYAAYWNTSTGQLESNIGSTNDNNTSWSQIAAQEIAPIGATSVYIVLTGTVAAANEIHYLDNMTITSNSSAQQINLGASNAQAILLGNNAETGSTSILGGGGSSAISLQASAGGVIGIGNGGSTNTIALGSVTSGAISLTSGSTIGLTIGATSTFGATANTANSGTGYGYNIVAGSDSGTTSLGGSISIDAGTGTTANGTISLGTTNAKAVTIGNSGSASTVNVQPGGTLNLGGGASSSINVQAGSNDPIAVGTANNASVSIGSISGSDTTLISGGTSGTAVSIQAGNSGTIAIGTNAANVIDLGNSTSATTTNVIGGGTLSIQSAVSGTIALGTTNSSTINVGVSSGSGTTNITSGGVTTIQSVGALNLGNSLSSGVNIQSVATGNISIGATSTSGQVLIGGTAETGNVTLGQSTASNTIYIGSSIGSGNSQTINIGKNTIGSTITTLGSTTAGSYTTINGGTGAAAVSIQAASGGMINIGSNNVNAVGIDTNAVTGVALSVNGGIQQTGFATPDTSGTYQNDWTELGECDITAQYNGCDSVIDIEEHNVGTSTVFGQATLGVNIYQQNALGGVPNLVMQTEGALEYLKQSDFELVTTANTGSATTVKLFIKNENAHGYFTYTSQLNQTSPGFTWTPNTAYIASLPTGSQTGATYADEYDSTLTVQPASNSTSTLSVNNSLGNSVLKVDTTDSCLNVGLGGTACVTKAASLVAYNSTASGTGLYGEDDAANSAGVVGYTSGTNGDGVYGEADAALEDGVFGISTAGVGVYGTSTSGYGIEGVSATGPGGFFQGGSSGTTAPTLLTRQNGSSTASLFQVQTSGTGVLLNVGSTGATTFENTSNSTVALSVQNLSGKNVFDVDTTNGQAILGQSSTGGVNGSLLLENTTNTNGVSIAAPNTTSAGSYTLDLPTAIPSSTGLCLETGSNSGSSNQLSFSPCSNSNASITQVSEVDAHGSAISTLADSPTTIGDLLVVTTEQATPTSSVSNVSGGGVITWTKVNSLAGASSHVDMWEGTITSTGASTITVTYSGATGTNEITASEFTADGVSSATTWGVDASGTKANTTSTIVTYPTLTPSDAGELYIGYAQSAGTQSGVPAGFNGSKVTGLNNEIVWNLDTVPGTNYNPTDTVAPTDPSTTVAAEIIAYVASTAINNSTSIQQGNFNVQSAASGTVAAVLQAASGDTTADLEDFYGSSAAGQIASNLELQVTNSGNITFDNTNATTANISVASATGAVGEPLTIAAGASSTVAGGNLVLQAGNGGTGVGTGGNVVIQGGKLGGSGTGGSVIVKPQTGSDTNKAFQVQNAAGTAVLNVDTTTAGDAVTITSTSTTDNALIITAPAGYSGLDFTSLTAAGGCNGFCDLLAVNSSGQVGLSNAAVSLTSPALAYWDGVSNPTGTDQSYPTNPIAALTGNATYVGGGNGVELNSTSGQAGSINWQFAQVPFEEIQFQFKAGTTGSAADATWFYSYADAVPTSEFGTGLTACTSNPVSGTDGGGCGYIIYFSEYHNCIGITYGSYSDNNQCGNATSTPASGNPYEPLASTQMPAGAINDGNFHNVEIQIIQNKINVDWDGNTLLSYTDSYTRDLTDYQDFGFGARSGGTAGSHFIKGLLVTKLTNTSLYDTDTESPLASDLWWNTASGSLGVDTSTPRASLEVDGTTSLQPLVSQTQLVTPSGTICQSNTAASCSTTAGYYLYASAAVFPNNTVVGASITIGGVTEVITGYTNTHEVSVQATTGSDVAYIPATSAWTYNAYACQSSSTTSCTTTAGNNVFGQGTDWTAATVAVGDVIDWANGSTAVITAIVSTTDLTVSGATQDVAPASFTINYPGLNLIAGGKTGIGTVAPTYNLDVQANVAASYAERIYNTNSTASATAGAGSDGLLIQLGVASASLLAGNNFVAFAGSTGSVFGSIQGGNDAVAYQTTAADYAEYFRSDSSTTPQPGDIVSLDPTDSQGVIDSTGGSAVGIVSTNPGFIGNMPPGCASGDTTCTPNTHNDVVVALTGQVPTQVSVANGNIKAGDPIMASSTPGVGELATGYSEIIGYAEEAATADGEIHVLIQPGLYDPVAADNVQGTSNTPLTINSGLDVKGDATFEGNVSVASAVTAASLTVANAEVSVNLNVTGTTTTTNLVVTGSATTQTLTVSGDLNIGGDTVLTGKVNTRQATIKTFTASSVITAGQAVVIDNTTGNAGDVTTTSTAGDPRVIGVAVTSAAADGDSIEVAIGGWVQVDVDTTPNAQGVAPTALVPGQLVVTSATAGSVDASASPTAGSVLGKTTDIEDSNNLVWILITLQ